MAQHNDLGRRGERLAQRYLRLRWYRILDTNWRCGNMEIDIIAKRGKTIAFVEVKTRSSEVFGTPEQAVDRRREQRLTTAANAYLQLHHLDLEPRFDIISIVLNDHEKRIRHLKDAFLPFARYY